ncbi:MAG TPA: glycosyltransferase family 4 protein [Gemmatimonadaceae bacterium]|nr:glycosyltransferase family 4 protein [Gemmatimonadaceae bacterium]
MRIVFVASAAQLGGAELSLLDVCASVRAARPGWPLALVVPGEGPLAERAIAERIDVITAPYPDALARFGDSSWDGVGKNDNASMRRMLSAASAATRYGFALRSRLRALQPDIVHANGFKAQLLAAWWRPSNARVIWHMRDFVSNRPLMARALRASSHRCDLAIANSASVAADTRDVCGRALAIEVVHNAIDLERFSPTGATLDLDALANLPSAPEGTIRVGLLATLANWKGHDVFVDAMAMLPADLPVRGYVIGGSLYETLGSQHSLERVRAHVVACGMSSRVGVTGYVERSDAALRALDVVVHASERAEPFGRVVAEAAACRRATIVSPRGGVTEIIEDGVTALTHEPGNAKSLAGQIERLVREPALRERIASAANAVAVDRFDRARLADALLPIYDSLHAHERARVAT